MNERTDSELLHAYARSRDEEAFAELVRRHIDFVYSAAIRMVRDSHLADDVAQGVFIALAKDAQHLGSRKTLLGWLHRTAQNIAAKIVRSDVRRKTREQEAAIMITELSTSVEAKWGDIEPYFDAAMEEINETDREAIFLRYFERKSASDIAAALGISAEAAQKRVNRGVERLRSILAERAVHIGTAGLVIAISENAAQTAPSELLTTIVAKAALGTTATSVGATGTFTKAISMTSLQKGLAIGGIVILSATTVYQTHRANALSREGEISPKTPAAEISSDASAAALTRLREENAQLQTNLSELLQLRGEVALLRRENQELTRSRQNLKQALAAEIQSRSTSTNGIVFQNKYIPRDEWQKKGNSEPYEAVVTLLSTLRDDDLDNANKLLVPGTDPQNTRNIFLYKKYWDRTAGLQIVDIIINNNTPRQAIIGGVIEQKTDIGVRQSVRRWFLVETNGSWLFTGGF